MKKIIYILSLLVFCQSLQSQISNIIPSSTAIALTSVADTHNWSGFNNPAILGYLNNSELAIQFENRYLLSQLSTKSFQFAFTTNLMNAGLSFSHFGYSLYNEMLLGISFARNFSDKFAMGIQFNYYTAFFNGSNSYYGALIPQIGLSVKLSSDFSLGFNTFNPLQSDIKTEFVVKRVPSMFSLGTEYHFSQDVVWRTQLDKEVSSNYRLAMGFEYQMLQQLEFKIGAYGSDYLIPCLGVGFNTGLFLVDLNIEMHPLLGLNPLAAIKYRFGK